MADYATITDLCAALSITDMRDDPRLGASITAASRQIDDFCGRRFWADDSAVVRYYFPDDDYELVVDDISTVDGLLVAVDDGSGSYGTSLTIATDFLVGPVNAVAENSPFTCLLAVAGSWPTGGRRPGVRVTAKFGWPSVPDPVNLACLVQAKNLFKAPAGTLVGFQPAGLDAGVVRIPPLDPIAVALLSPYVKVVV